jgi:catechol 2,3-dioxygenase-like lactoylglutathione lyase family enzyme
MAKPVHSMVRVFDEAKSLDFYARAFGLEVADHLKFPDFALIYLRGALLLRRRPRRLQNRSHPAGWPLRLIAFNKRSMEDTHERSRSSKQV